jgi:TPR repeat protein
VERACELRPDLYCYLAADQHERAGSAPRTDERAAELYGKVCAAGDPRACMGPSAL